jgi:hypothetical protein
VSAAVFGRVPYERAEPARRPSSPSSHSPLPSIRLPRRAGIPKPGSHLVVSQFDGYYHEGHEGSPYKYGRLARGRMHAILRQHVIEAFFLRSQLEFSQSTKNLTGRSSTRRRIGSRLGPVEWFKTLTMEDRTRYVSGMGSGKTVDGNMCIMMNLPHTSGRLTQRSGLIPTFRR